MRWMRCAGMVLALTSAATVRADDQAECKAILEKAVQARGGLDKVAKLQASTWKGKGDFHGMGVPIPYTGDWAMQLPNKSRVAIEFDANGMKIVFAMVYNGKEGWRKIADDVAPLDEDQLKESRAGLYANSVMSIAPVLKGTGYQLAPLGAKKEEGKELVGVKVSRMGERDVNLFFDTKTHLLAKAEYVVKNEGGQELNQEMWYSDYKDVDGVKCAMKLKIHRDGKPWVDSEVTEMKLAEKLDDSVFAKP